MSALDQGSATATTFKPQSRGGLYYCVRADLDTGGYTLSNIVYADSARATPGRVIPLAPLGRIMTLAPEFQWIAEANTETYDLQVLDLQGRPVYSASSSADEAGCGAGGQDCSLIPAVELPMGNLVWQIRACSGSHCGPWSETTGFHCNLMGSSRNRFARNDDATVSDSNTGLMWLLGANSLTWYRLHEQTDEEFARYGDWRLATITELSDYLEHSTEAIYVNNKVHSLPFDYWSGSAGRDVAWFARFTYSCEYDQSGSFVECRRTYSRGTRKLHQRCFGALVREESSSGGFGMASPPPMVDIPFEGIYANLFGLVSAADKIMGRRIYSSGDTAAPTFFVSAARKEASDFLPLIVDVSHQSGEPGDVSEVTFSRNFSGPEQTGSLSMVGYFPYAGAEMSPSATPHPQRCGPLPDEFHCRGFPHRRRLQAAVLRQSNLHRVPDHQRCLRQRDPGRTADHRHRALKQGGQPPKTSGGPFRYAERAL